MTRQRKREMAPLGEAGPRPRSDSGFGSPGCGLCSRHPVCTSVPAAGGAFCQGREWTRLRSYFCCGQYDHDDIATWLSPREARRRRKLPWERSSDSRDPLWGDDLSAGDSPANKTLPWRARLGRSRARVSVCHLEEASRESWHAEGGSRRPCSLLAEVTVDWVFTPLVLLNSSLW